MEPRTETVAPGEDQRGALLRPCGPVSGLSPSPYAWSPAVELHLRAGELGGRAAPTRCANRTGPSRGRARRGLAALRLRRTAGGGSFKAPGVRMRPRPRCKSVAFPSSVPGSKRVPCSETGGLLGPRPVR